MAIPGEIINYFQHIILFCDWVEVVVHGMHKMIGNTVKPRFSTFQVTDSNSVEYAYLFCHYVINYENTLYMQKKIYSINENLLKMGAL